MHNAHLDRTVLDNLPRDAEGHFRLVTYSLLGRLFAHLNLASMADPSLDLFAQYPFLSGYQALLEACHPPDLLVQDQAAWWVGQAAAWEAQVEGHLPLRALAQALDLSPAEGQLLALAGLVEEDIRFGAVFAALQQPLAARRPCIGLAGWLLSDPAGAPLDIWLTCQRLMDAGLLLAENQADPRSEWLLRVPSAIWDAVRGRLLDRPAPGIVRHAAADFPPVEDLILPADLHAQVRRAPALTASGQISALVLRGMTGSGRRTVLGAIARSLGRDLLVCEEGAVGAEAGRLLGPLATLTGALPVLRCDPGPGETIALAALPGYTGPVGVTLGRSGGLRGPLMSHALNLTLPPPDYEARRRLWQAAQVPLDSAELDEIARRFLLTGGLIRRAAGLAHAYSTLDGRSTVDLADVQRAMRALNRQSLDTLAVHLEAVGGWDDLIAGEAIAPDLRALEVRCRERERLREHAGAGFRRTLNRGVRALFSGPSGTGKTLAARALAAALQMDLYRVDLAAVVNKYIGETERNLNQVFSRAEELDVILLLDEGDALMTRRTEVRNSNDRYANMETNYLLQRLESYEGIVIITTNAGQRIDTAFLRRLDVVVDFTPPEAAERWLLWIHHLPAEHAVSPAFLQEVADRCALTGGQIRNAALHATLLALSSAEPVADHHLEAALQREYRKSGAAYPLRDRAPAGGQISQVRQFAARLDGSRLSEE